MGIKRIIIISFIVIFALGTYFYLVNEYNLIAVEINFRGNITNEEFKHIKDMIHLGKYTINYSMPYRDDELIMTTGQDRFFKDMNLLAGQYITDLDDKITVVGDRVANKYFKSDMVIGKEIQIFNEEYKIIGVLEDSSEIYIPYDSSLFQQDWENKSIKYEILYEDIFYRTANRVERNLSNLGLEVYDAIIYKEKIFVYSNVIILLVVILLVVYTVRIFKKLKKQCLEIVEDYKEQSDVVEWYVYIKDNVKLLINAIIKAIAISFMILVISKIIALFRIFDTSIPDNLFSPSSYINVAALKLSQLLLHLKKGFSDITIDTIFINFIFLICIFLINLFMEKVIVNKTKRK